MCKPVKNFGVFFSIQFRLDFFNIIVNYKLVNNILLTRQRGPG